MIGGISSLSLCFFTIFCHIDSYGVNFDIGFHIYCNMCLCSTICVVIFKMLSQHYTKKYDKELLLSVLFFYKVGDNKVIFRKIFVLLSL